MTLVPVRDVAPRRLLLPDHSRWVEDLTWVPVTSTEFHLACRYFPIAVQYDNNAPKLGLIVSKDYLNHPLLDANGTWRGGYRPVGLRCFPFQANAIGDDPLANILIDEASEYLSATSGLALVEGGQPTKLVADLHKLFALLKRGEDTFAGILDQFLIAGLLAPLDGVGEPGGAPLYVVDRVRLAQMKGSSLAAMARHGFLSVDIAIAAAFSLQNLKPAYRPKAATGAQQKQSALDTDLVAIDDLSLALDDGELIPLWNIAGLQEEVRAG